MKFQILIIYQSFYNYYYYYYYYYFKYILNNIHLQIIDK